MKKPAPAFKKKHGIHLNPANKGKLHETLGVPKGQKIPPGKLSAATHSSNALTRKRAVFAENAKRFNHSGHR